jgi:hypothetical protein
MLWGPIVAIDWEEHAKPTAVRYSSLFAASWALQFLPMYAGRVFCVSRWTCMAELNRNAISPEKAASMRSRIVPCMEESER